MAEKTVIVFDFDRTLIDDDSDRWVMTNMGLTNLFLQLRRTLPWNSLMVCHLSLDMTCDVYLVSIFAWNPLMYVPFPLIRKPIWLNHKLSTFSRYIENDSVVVKSLAWFCFSSYDFFSLLNVFISVLFAHDWSGMLGEVLKWLEIVLLTWNTCGSPCFKTQVIGVK